MISILYINNWGDNLETKKIKYVLEGKAFENGLSIYELNIGLLEFQHLIESSYLTLSGQQRMTKNDRAKLKIISREIKQGSFISEFELQVIETAKQLVLPILVTLTPSEIWELTKETFKFLKLIFSLKKQKKPFEINFGDYNTGATVRVIKSQNITNQYTFNGPVYICGEQSLPYYKNLTKLIESGDVERIVVESNNEEAVHLGMEDKDLFVLPESKEELPITLNAEIYRFDKYKNIGKMRVFPNQKIPEGDYTFSVDDKQQIEKFIYCMIQNVVKVKVVVEYTEDAFVGNKISNLKLFDIA